MIRRSLLLAVLVAAAAFAGGESRAQPQDEVVFKMAPLAIETARGVNPFTVELAETPRQRARGLMFRRELGPGRGMLFLYPRAERVSMWMKNTFVPLDMLFIGGDGRIVRIAENTPPQSTDLISSGIPVKAVLELAAGTAARLDIREGDRVLYPAFAERPKAP